MCLPLPQLTGKLERIFTVTDEQVFKDARKDEARRNTYKLLASLREVGAARSAHVPVLTPPSLPPSLPIELRPCC